MTTAALGEFLAARRGRLRPADVDLPVHGRRRTAGLRREEVAALAGVSIDYYTRLEQGRDITPSPGIVHTLADALRLSDDEREHLHRLAGQAPERRVATYRQVRAQTRALLQALHPTPAWVLTPSLDILAWNQAMVRVLIDPCQIPPERRNFAVLAFTDPELRTRFLDWPDVAREVVAILRDAQGRYDDPRLTELIAALTTDSDDFQQLWGNHDVVRTCAGLKRLRHPDAGDLTLHYESLAVDRDGQRIVTYLPADRATELALIDATRTEDPVPHLRSVR